MTRLRIPRTGWAAVSGLLTLWLAAALAPNQTQAKPEYAAKEGKKCAHCHENPKGGGPRNYRGKFYRQNMYSFAGFDNAAEAKKAGTDPLPDENLLPPPVFKAATDPKTLPDFGEWTGPGGVIFIKIPAGTFTQGTTAAQKAQMEKAGAWTAMDAVEQPAREVRITRPFLLSKTEVSQAQWKALMGGGSPSAFKGDTLPVENVTWGDTQAFCKALHDLDSSGAYRLPTEAEWEYAARAGSTDVYEMGTDKSPVTEATLKDYVWMNSTAANKTQPVGSKKPNVWGLYDMLGNVWEWCQDWYFPAAYSALPASDPVYKSAGATERVLRGGCWYLDARAHRVALRGGNLPTYKSQYAGFRVARGL